MTDPVGKATTSGSSTDVNLASSQPAKWHERVFKKIKLDQPLSPRADRVLHIAKWVGLAVVLAGILVGAGFLIANLPSPAFEGDNRVLYYAAMMG